MLRYILLLMLLSPIVYANTTQQKEIKPEKELKEYSQFNDFIKSHKETYIIVNRGSQQLVVIKNNNIILSMKVIVGRRYWTTPLAETEITHIITNPFWTVPRSIANRETIPNILKDPQKYQQQGYRLYYRDTYYDTSYLPFFHDHNEIQIKQLPSKWNVLGKVKFRLKDIGAIYMHDTNNRSKFKKTRRKLSHGCIRLEQPLNLLSTISQIQYKNSTKEKWHKLEKPIPVYIVDWGKYGY